MNFRISRMLFAPEGEPAAGGGDGGAPAPAASGDGGGTPAPAASDSGGDGGGTPAPAASGGDGGNYFEKIPDDWRSQFARGDETRAKQLERYVDPFAALDAGFHAQERIRKGEISSGLPENPSDEQLAAYRESHGVPATPDAYEVQLDAGLVLGDNDKQILKPVYEIAHADNIPASTMSKLTNAVLKGRQDEVDARATQDNLDSQTVTQQLRDNWGADFKPNINNIMALVTREFPADVAEKIQSARMPDGTALFNVPEVLAGLASIERKLNPASTVVPNNDNPIGTAKEEYITLKNKMGTDEWHKDTDGQKRFQQLDDYLRESDPNYGEYGG